VIYLDSCLVIYLVEPESPSHASVLEAVASAGQTSVAVSGLVVMECLVGPAQDSDDGLRQDYERAFGSMALLPLTRPVFERAAGLRAEHRLKTPDAIHLAAALEHGCDELWTNDDRLSRAAGSFARVVGR
jgi:uncharacterized protein